jgi:hypothetical protein
VNDDQQTEMQLLSECTEAIRRYSEYKGWFEPGEFAGDWVCIMHVANMDPDADDAYVNVNSSMSMATHTAIGLLHAGLAEMSAMRQDPGSEG